MNKIGDQKLANSLKNGNGPTMSSNPRLKRGVGSRKLVQRRTFRFSNEATNGKPVPTQEYGTYLSNLNVSNENANNLLAYRTPNETQRITPMTKRNVQLTPNESKRFANLTQNKNSRKAMIKAIQTDSTLNSKTKMKMLQRIFALYTNDF
jgi:hypothetical protein